ncbi:unnamed protein product [Auanema sp. JU1783]|nr:unnamed protein product [Auanema sp. JU1783]
MADAIVPTLHQLCSVHFANIIGDGRVPSIDCPLPTQIGDAIFTALRDQGKLNEKTFDCFTKTNLQISRFDISRCECFDPNALAGMSTYNKLEVVNISHQKCPSSPERVCVLNLMEFVKNLHPDTYEKLRYLNIGGLGGVTCVFVLRNFPNLESLILNNRPICQRWLSYMSSFVPNLTMIDITGTMVSDITWLRCFPKLEVLIMHNVKVRTGCVHRSLSTLRALRVLDISKKVTDFAGDGSQESYTDLALAVVDILNDNKECPWPELRSIDISGNPLAGMGIDQAIEMVDTIILRCPMLQRVSVMATPLDGHSYVTPGNRNVMIVNCANRLNAMQALIQYWDTDRDVFTSHALHAVYYCLQSSYDDFNDLEVKKCARVVCKAMKRHLGNIGVQMAGSACLYHLCKMKRIRRLSISEVQECMERCLDAAETYRQMVQLQKNVWLTICNDYLLQLPGVDFYRTCKVALESMLSSRDASVARMTIAIVSIVTPKMRPPEAKELVGDERYVRHLVQLLNDNLRTLLNTPGPHAENSIFTLKFTLSALWNLTDESSTTCEVFFDAGGVLICFEILDIFENHSNIQTKVLGILNNVAEVPCLQKEIIENERWLQTLCDCLEGDFRKRDESGRNRSVERSYFAAGVLSNILVCQTWNNVKISKVWVNDLLTSVIMSWPNLQNAMVSYRSFLPFVRILSETNYSGAQMWCLWGINHVLAHKEKNAASMGYLTMLQQSDIPVHCMSLSRSEITHPYVRELSSQIEAAWLRGADIVGSEDASSLHLSFVQAVA